MNNEEIMMEILERIKGLEDKINTLERCINIMVKDEDDE